jgi:hypothetical protein
MSESVEKYEKNSEEYRNAVGVVLPSIFGTMAASCNTVTDARFALVLFLFAFCVSPSRQWLRDFRDKENRESSRNATLNLREMDRQFFGLYAVPFVVVGIWLFMKSVNWITP